VVVIDDAAEEGSLIKQDRQKAHNVRPMVLEGVHDPAVRDPDEEAGDAISRTAVPDRVKPLMRTQLRRLMGKHPHKALHWRRKVKGSR
jgi:hypothetical protein